MKEIKQMKQNKGITLLALVITVILLLILVGITLNLTIGENGILTKAKYAKGEWQNAQAEEKDELNKLYSEMLIATNDSSQITVNIEDLNKLIDAKVEERTKELIEKALPNSINSKSVLMTATNRSCTKTNESLTLKNFDTNFLEDFNTYFSYDATTGEITCQEEGWYYAHLYSLITHGMTSNWTNNVLSLLVNETLVAKAHVSQEGISRNVY